MNSAPVPCGRLEIIFLRSRFHESADFFAILKVGTIVLVITLRAKKEHDFITYTLFSSKKLSQLKSFVILNR